MTTVSWTPEQDQTLTSMRGDGYRWYEIAMSIGDGRMGMDCQQRWNALELANAGGAPVEPVQFQETRRARSYVDPSTRLLRAQLRTGQYFPQQRAEYLARHGEDSE